MNEIYKVENILPDIKDDRDFIFSSEIPQTIPVSIDLRFLCGDIENQLNTGSCVANSSVSALEIILKRGNKFFNLSRLFQYYNLREPYADLKDKDVGAYTRDAFKFVNKLGICSEDSWNFDVSKVNVKPVQACYTEALNHLVTKYERILTDDKCIGNIKAVISKGYPVLFGASIGKTLYSIGKNVYKGVNNDSIGGHAMVIVGYDDTKKYFIVENSWGSTWGDKGYFYFDYSAFLKDTHDIWVCTEFDGLKFESFEIVVPTWFDKIKILVKENWEEYLLRGIFVGTFLAFAARIVFGI
jgi:C1A family cysteine protease